MKFDWKEYLALADQLMQERKDIASEEACLRSAISRAYYAAIISSRNFAITKDKFFARRGSSIHRQIADHFKLKNDIKQVAVGIRLSKLANKRNLADYEDEMPDLLQEAEKSVRLAKDILTLLDSFSE